MINASNFTQLVLILILVYFQFHFVEFTNLLQPLYSDKAIASCIKPPLLYTVKILNIGTCMSEQTV